MVLDGIWDINIDWYFKFKEKLKSVSGKGLQKARGPRPALGSARPKPVYGAGRAAGLNLDPARRPAFNFFKKNNILYFYIYISNSFNKHKRNVTQLVIALKFKLEGRGSNPPLSLPF